MIGILERIGIDYMVSGSFASSLHGAPRMTRDADLVIESDEAKIRAFVRALGEDFYADEEAAAQAVRLCDLFNVVHLESGLKIDLIVRKDRPFSREEFSRRSAGTIEGRSAMFVTPEDAILSKLEWAKKGNSDRQRIDALEVIRVQGDRLDWAYLERWAKELGLGESLDRLKREV